MESALIVSRTEKGTEFFVGMLKAVSPCQTVVSSSCGEAGRLMLERDFDLVIINAPLGDESGEELARRIASKGFSQAILVVRSEAFDAVSAVCEDDGVLVVAKPMNKAVFWAALKLARAAQSRVRRMRNENAKLQQKIEDIRIVDRAKCILISHLCMSEQEAHRTIEKQAMDMRVSKRTIAEGLLKTYEN